MLLSIDEAIEVYKHPAQHSSSEHREADKIAIQSMKELKLLRAEHLKVGKENKDNCDGKCTHCNETQLPNIKDKNCDGIGYSYAYKTDCSGDRYIKVDEVRYLLKCERNKAIDDFAERLCYKIKSEIDACADELQWIDEIAEQLKK